MVLTNMLPSQGNGTYRVLMYAPDREGHTQLLGDADHHVRQRERDEAVRGHRHADARRTGVGDELRELRVGADPAAKDHSDRRLDDLGAGRRRCRSGTVDYNHARPDIAALFPGLEQHNGAVGFRVLDTTTLANGLHTISWTVTDSRGRLDGIGSRFFTVANGVGVADGGGERHRRRACARGRAGVADDIAAAAAR